MMPVDYPADAGELAEAVDHMRVGCLELRVWLSASSDHGQLAGKKLDLAEEHLQELMAQEDEVLAEPEPGTAESLREDRLARARAGKKRESGGGESGVDWKQRCEAAEQALGEAQADLMRMRTLLAPVQRDTAPPPPLAAMRTASRETMQMIEGLEAEGKFVEAAELLAEKLEALKRVQDGTGAWPPHTYPRRHSCPRPRAAHNLLLRQAEPFEGTKQKGSLPPDGIVQDLRRQWSSDTDTPS